MKRANRATILIGIALALLAASCGSSTGSGTALQNVEQRSFSGDRDRPYSSFQDLIVQTEVRSDDSEFALIGGAQLIVRGTFTAVEEGKSFIWDADERGEEIRTELKFGDSNAMAETVHMTFVVSEILAPDSIESALTIRVGQAFDTGVSLSVIERDYLGLGEVVLFLNRTAVFDYDDDLWAILEDGALMATVDAKGVLGFPTLREPESLMGGDNQLTISELAG